MRSFIKGEQKNSLSGLRYLLFGLLFQHVPNNYTLLRIMHLQSCCDCMVFSNNPGVDLHLHYRGRKMNERIQCVFGVTSALTVIYNNFPKYAKK